MAFLGVPHDIGTTYRSGPRFGPQAVRRISALYDGYSIDVNGGVSLSEELELCDLGDIFTIPSNLEKSFDQVTKAVSHVFGSGVFPVLCGGDHSLSFPFIRGIAPHIEGNLGIIHMDRHLDIQERDMDERMHDTPSTTSPIKALPTGTRMVPTTPQPDSRIVTPRISCSWGLADGTAYQVGLWWPIDGEPAS